MSEQLPVSVWPTAQQPSKEQRKGRYVTDAMAHPGKMLPAIARQAIETYSNPGDVVLDPMCGIGTTLVEAMHLDRIAVGIEYEHRWTEVAAANIAHAANQGATGSGRVHCGDGRDMAALVDPQFVGQVGLVLTSPPYGTSLHGHVTKGDGKVNKSNSHYSDNKANLGNAATKTLLEAFTEILRASELMLRPGGVVAITTRPWRRDGYLVDLPGEVVRLAESVGLQAFERNVALLCGLKGEALVPRSSFFQLNHVRKSRSEGIPLNVIAHEDLIVFRKA